MKKMILGLLMVLLVSCGGPKTFEYEKMAVELTYQTEVVEKTFIGDEKLIQSIYDVLSDIELKPSKEVVMMVQIELKGTPTIYIDGNIVEIDGETYELTVLAEKTINSLMQQHLSSQITETIVEEETEEITDVAEYTYLDSLSNGVKIYYKEHHNYFNRKRTSEIIAFEDGVLKPVYSGELSLPVMNKTKSNIAFVSGVGFEQTGTLYVYDGSLKEVTSDELKEKMTDNRTIKDAEWFDEETLFIIFGFNTGTVSQGGDVYFIKTNDGDMRMVIDAKDAKEIVNVSYSDDVLTFEVVTWLDKTYQTYDYNFETIIMSESMKLLPIKILVDPVTEL